jgi:hypothetical protein
MTRRKFKDVIRFIGGFILERPDIDTADYAAEGSRNVLFSGQAEPIPFKGLELVDGIGALGAIPVGGGVGGLTPIPPPPALTFSSGPCTFLPDSITETDGEFHLTRTVAAGVGLCGAISDQSIGLNGTVQFRIAAYKETSVSLVYTNTNCGHINSGTDSGWGIRNTFHLGDHNAGLFYWRNVAGSVTQEAAPGSFLFSTVFKIVVNNGVVTFWKNGVLVATSPVAATGDPLYVRIIFGEQDAEVYLTRFDESPV